MGEENLHPYEQQVIDLFSTAWTCKSGVDSDPSVPAKKLAQYVTEAKDPSPGVYLWSAILAIQRYASSCPQALDFMLLAYASACEQLPATVSNEYGRGPAAGLQQLKWWLIEEADGFQGTLFPTSSTGTVTATDCSNLSFTRKEVDQDIDRVLLQVEEWREERTKWVIAAAMQARCFSLNIIRINDGRQIETLIDSGLHREQSRWSKAGFIGACVLIRGCAKSLIDHLSGIGKHDKIDSWTDMLKRFLQHGEDSSDPDFVVTCHASVSIAFNMVI